MNQAFEEWWRGHYGGFDQTNMDVKVAKRVALDSWNAAIEHIRTTEPMPVNERSLTSLIRIEDVAFRILNKVSPIPKERIARAAKAGWTDIKEINGVWVGDEPGSVRHKEIPA